MAKLATRTGPGRPPGGADDARQALFLAAREEFARRGYSGARTRTILEAAGVTAPVLYHHFGSKAELYGAVVRDMNDVAFAAFDEHITDRDSIHGVINGILDAAIAVQANNPSLSEFVVSAPIDFGRNPELAFLAPEMRRLREFLTEKIEAAADVTEETKRDVTQATMVTVFGLSRLAATLSPSEYAEAVEAVRGLTRGTLLSITGPQS